MSIASEIQRIQTAKTNLITGLNNSGFDVPQSTLINDVVTTVNDDVLPLIDNRYDTPFSISTKDIIIGKDIRVTVNTSTEATGSVNFKIGGWIDDSVSIINGKAKLVAKTEFSGSVATAGNHLVLATYDGDDAYKPAMATDSFRLSKAQSNIVITEATVDGDAVMIGFSAKTSDTGSYCESFDIGGNSWQTGCVVIFFDGYPIGIANLTNARGSIYCDIGNYESGTYQIQVAFLGDNKYGLSVSNPVSIEIP